MEKEKVTLLEIENNSGGSNLAGDKLVFQSNIGTIGMDLRSGLEVAYTLIDCLGLNYRENTVVEAEEKIVKQEEGVSN